MAGFLVQKMSLTRLLLQMVYVLVAELATSWASLRFNESDEKTGTSFSQFFSQQSGILG